MKKLAGQLQPLINDGFILELRDAAMFTHWYKRLDPTATTWCEGIFDIEDVMPAGIFIEILFSPTELRENVGLISTPLILRTAL